MGAGSGELSLTEMSIETAIEQIDKANTNKSLGPDCTGQGSPMGNEWSATGSIYPHRIDVLEEGWSWLFWCASSAVCIKLNKGGK